MNALLQQLVRLLGQLARWKLETTVTFVVFALVMSGAVALGQLFAIAVLVIGARVAMMVAHAMRPPPPTLEACVSEVHALAADTRSDLARRLGLSARASRETIATALHGARIADHGGIPSRAARWAEVCGLGTWLLLVPGALLFATRDFVAPHAQSDWQGAALLLLGGALYAWPLRWRDTPSRPLRRAVWWCAPTVPALLACAIALNGPHAYLNPFDADHTRLAAERVLALHDNVQAAREAAWVRDYVLEQFDAGHIDNAVALLQRLLRMTPDDTGARAMLSTLQNAPYAPAAASAAAQKRAYTALWPDNASAPRLPRCGHELPYDRMSHTTVALVTMGEVDDRARDIVGAVVARELGLGVCAWPERIALPPHGRVHGIAYGRQWQAETLAAALGQGIGAPPRAPLRYLVLTPVSLYAGDANFLFSSTFPWGAVVSSAQLREEGDSQDVVTARLAKQSLGALIKSFGVPPATARECVTSYARDLREFDAKGNRPTAETLGAFQAAVAQAEGRQ